MEEVLDATAVSWRETLLVDVYATAVVLDASRLVAHELHSLGSSFVGFTVVESSAVILAAVVSHTRPLTLASLTEGVFDAFTQAVTVWQLPLLQISVSVYPTVAEDAACMTVASRVRLALQAFAFATEEESVALPRAATAQPSDHPFIVPDISKVLFSQKSFLCFISLQFSSNVISRLS